MSSRKRPLTEIPQNRSYDREIALATPKSRNYTTPYASTTRRVTGGHGIIHANRPGSARTILRRLARVTAPITQRRIATPTIANDDKENIGPVESDEDAKDDLRKPVTGFHIEESIEEEDSDLPVAPTPSALLEASDDDELDQPTVTFLDVSQARSAVSRKQQIPLDENSILYSEPVLPAHEGELQHESTFLSERGRRAVSEDRTRMSRYSFGSIRMSDFGSELEIRRESDRQQKLAELELQDNYGVDYGNEAHLAGETEVLKGLQALSPPAADDSSEEEPGEISFNVELVEDEELQPDEPLIEDFQANAAQVNDIQQPQSADTILEPDDNPIADEMEESRHDLAESRRHTLLESMIATAAAKKHTKKQKMNQQGKMVPGLPSSLMKRVIHQSQEKANKRKTTFGKDHIRALEQATEWFFEQASSDLDAYSSHGRRRKRIDVDDVLLLMRRQRVLKGRRDLRKLAKDWLPREILNELELPDHL